MNQTNDWTYKLKARSALAPNDRLHNRSSRYSTYAITHIIHYMFTPISIFSCHLFGYQHAHNILQLIIILTPFLSLLPQHSNAFTTVKLTFLAMYPPSSFNFIHFFSFLLIEANSYNICNPKNSTFLHTISSTFTIPTIEAESTSHW